MSDTSFGPGGPEIPASSLVNGDGSTTTLAGIGQISTDLNSDQNVAIEALVAGGTIAIGAPVYPASGTAFDLAVADTELHACVLGLLTEPVAVGDALKCRDRGLLSLTVAEWNAVVVGATTGLTPGTYYFLSATGKPITATAPSTSTNYVVRLGLAITATVMKVDVGLQGVVGGIP